MVAIRKKLAGSDSYGHVWKTDGAVVDVEPDEAVSLLAIPDGGFSEADDITEPGGQESFSEVGAPGDIAEHDDGHDDDGHGESDDEPGDEHAHAKRTSPRRKRSV